PNANPPFLSSGRNSAQLQPLSRIADQTVGTESSPDALSTTTTRNPGSAATSATNVRRQSTTSPAARELTMTAAVERVFNGREPPEARKPRKDSDRRWERLGQWPSSLPREEREQVGELVRLEALQQSVRHERPGTGRVAFDVVRRHAASL